MLGCYGQVLCMYHFVSLLIAKPGWKTYLCGCYVSGCFSWNILELWLLVKNHAKGNYFGNLSWTPPFVYPIKFSKWATKIYSLDCEEFGHSGYLLLQSSSSTGCPAGSDMRSFISFMIKLVVAAMFPTHGANRTLTRRSYRAAGDARLVSIWSNEIDVFQLLC